MKRSVGFRVELNLHGQAWNFEDPLVRPKSQCQSRCWSMLWNSYQAPSKILPRKYHQQKPSFLKPSSGRGFPQLQAWIYRGISPEKPIFHLELGISKGNTPTEICCPSMWSQPTLALATWIQQRIQAKMGLFREIATHVFRELDTAFYGIFVCVYIYIYMYTHCQLVLKCRMPINRWFNGKMSFQLWFIQQKWGFNGWTMKNQDSNNETGNLMRCSVFFGGIYNGIVGYTIKVGGWVG